MSRDEYEAIKDLSSDEEERWKRVDIYDLAIGAITILNLCTDREIDAIFYLDKSARPIDALVTATWRIVQPEVSLPTVHFIDIGRPNNEPPPGQQLGNFQHI